MGCPVILLSSRELAGKAGVPLTEMTIAFVICHPGVTSAISAPWDDGASRASTGRGRGFSGGALNRASAIVPPGVTSHANGGWVSPALDPAVRRRWAIMACAAHAPRLAPRGRVRRGSGPAGMAVTGWAQIR
jgi:hypothetical protein